MNQIQKTAQSYSKNGFSVIPTTQNKIPAIGEWRQFQNRPMSEEECMKHFEKARGLGLICGGSKRLTAIDLDLKNDQSGDFYQRLLQKIPSEILSKCYIQKTQNSGYHWVFSCEKVEPSQKIASRLTTPEEKHRIYIENYENPLTRSKAFKIASNYDSVCLIETRGEGAYILMPPTRGYEFQSGKIQELSLEEYEELFVVLRSMCELNKIRKNDSRFSEDKSQWKVSPFQAYNQEGNSVFLLESNGWSVVGSARGKNIRLKRPGNSSSHSGIYDSDTRIFSVFSTSTNLDTNRGYTPSDLFVELECAGNHGLAYSRLIEMGFGVKA